MSAHGLSEATLETVRRILAAHPAVERAILFGSRAMGRQRRGSDIDLALVGEALGLRELGAIAGAFEESALPYLVDLCLWHRIDHPGLRAHIQRVGQVLYERSPQAPVFGD